ncbi:MAG: hypothetical protein KBC95_04800, partial [Candidatus Peribacteraceae bacterium]|nr:hypothetical protein [Candidatus Peribacteraceae bacterium]
DQWERGNLPPTELRDWIATMHGDVDIGSREWSETDPRHTVADLDAAIAATRGHASYDPTTGELPDVTDPNMWGGMNNSTKDFVTHHLGIRAGIPTKLSYLNGRLDKFDEALRAENVNGLLTAVEKTDLPGQQVEPARPGIFASLNVEFFSVNQIIEGFKKWKERYTEAIKGYNNSKSNVVAKKVGNMFKWLPYGEDVNKSLSDKVTNDQAKERKDFMEAIGTRELGFNDLFGPGGVLSQSTGKPSQFLAILEFASQKGWLYPLMKYNFIDDKALPGVEAFGFNIRSIVPQDYMDNDILASYLSGLLNKSNANGNKDMQDQMAVVEGKNDMDSYLALFDKAMKGNGYWKAIGILRGALRKAKDPATSAIFAARLNFWLRQPNVGQYMNDTILSKFGEGSWNQIPYTMAYYTVNAADIQQWSKSDKKGEAKAAEAKDPLSRAILQVEQEVNRRAGKELEEPQKAKIVGAMLAGQTPEIADGKHISIFEPQFGSVRELSKLFGAFEDFDMRTAAPGYFSNSEVVLLPESFLNTLFDISSTGQLPNAGKIIAYSGGIIGRAKQLDALSQRDPKMAEAAANFRREIKRKLNQVIRSKILDRGNPQDLLRLKFEGDGTPRYVLNELIANGLLDANVLGLARAP